MGEKTLEVEPVYRPSASGRLSVHFLRQGQKISIYICVRDRLTEISVGSGPQIAMFTVNFVPITPVIAKKVTPRSARTLLRILEGVGGWVF